MPNCPGISPATAERRRPTARLGGAGRKSMRRRPSTRRRIARPRSRSRRSGSGESANAPRRRWLNEKSASGGRRLSIGLKPPWIPPAGSMTGGCRHSSQVGSFRRTVADRRSAMGKGTIQTRSVAPAGPRVGGPLQRRVKYRVVRALSVASEVADRWRGRSHCTPQHWCRHCPTRRCPLRRPD
jgi:hypothetical protein